MKWFIPKLLTFLKYLGCFQQKYVRGATLRTNLTKPNHNQFCPAVSPHVSPGRICIKPLAEDELISEYIRQSGCWEGDIVSSVLLAMIHFPTATFLGRPWL